MKDESQPRVPISLAHAAASYLEILANVHYLLRSTCAENENLRPLFDLQDNALKALIEIIGKHSG